MIKKFAIVAVAASGLLLTSGGWAVADSAAHRATDGTPVVCAGGNQAAVSNICGNTNTYNADVLGDLLSSLSISPVIDALSGSGGNN